MRERGDRLDARLNERRIPDEVLSGFVGLFALLRRTQRRQFGGVQLNVVVQILQAVAELCGVLDDVRALLQDALEALQTFGRLRS